MKLLINEEFRKLYPDKLSKSVNTNDGIIKKSDFNSRKKVIETHTGVKFLKTEPSFKDLYNNLKRGPQLITLKDAGFITSELGVMKGDRVLDCGGGSGGMTLFLANMVGSEGEVVSVEKDERFVKIIKKNLEMFNFNNVKLVNKDLNDYTPSKCFDSINLDVPSPWKFINFCINHLKNGGLLSVYCPNTTQVSEMREECSNTCLQIERVSELLLRNWKVKKRINHPCFKMLGHTGFVMILRKVKI